MFLRICRVLAVLALGLASPGCFEPVVRVAVDGGQEAALSCGSGTDACAGLCVNLRIDSAHCGRCGNSCGTNQACGGGACYANECALADCSAQQVCLNEACRARECIGVSCLTGQVCSEGICREESCNGQACPPGSICRSGVCTDVECAGVACPAGRECLRGRCEQGCTADQACSPANPCRQGVRSCATGTAVCNEREPVTPGTPCGAGQVCDQDGGCVGCASGQPCSSNPNPCKAGVLSCSGGTAVCEDAQTAAANGTRCGTSQACIDGACAPSSCSNAYRDGTETGTDCGGETCPACAPGQGCAVVRDCASKVCLGASCQAPTCEDGVQNGAETGVDCGAGPCRACALPTLIYSDTLDGPAKLTFDVAQTIHSRIENLGSSAQLCHEVIGISDGSCANPPAGWTSVPGNGWSYEAASGKWRQLIPPGSFPAGQYRSQARNPVTGAQTPSVLTAFVGAVLIYSDTLDGPAKTTFSASQTLHSRIEYLGSSAQLCHEVVGVSDGACGNPPNGWTNVPGSGWSYEAASGKWRQLIAPSSFPAGQYRSLARNPVTGVQAPTVVSTFTSP